MGWPRFSFLYLLVMLGGLLLFRARLRDRWQPLGRTLIGITLMLCICDAVAESRRLWFFPYTLGIDFLDVPLENVVITFATAINSLLLYLLVDGSRRP